MYARELCLFEIDQGKGENGPDRGCTTSNNDLLSADVFSHLNDLL